MPHRHARRVTALWLAALLVLAGALAVPAQTPADYQRLLGLGGGSDQPAPAEPPRQSRPAPEFDPASVPPPEAYAGLEGVGTEALLARTQRLVEVFRSRATRILLEAPKALEDLRVTLRAASPTGEPGYFVGVAVFALLLLAVGRAFASLFATYIARPVFVGLQKPEPVGYLEKLPVLVTRIGLTVVGCFLVTAMASLIGIFYYDGHEATLNTTIVIFACYAALMLIDTIWRMVLCPFLPNYRIPAIGTSEARRLYRHLSYVSGFGIVSIGFGYWARALGVPEELDVLFTVGLSGLTVVGVLLTLHANRRSIDRIVLDGQDRRQISWVTLVALRLWWPLATVYMVGAWAKIAFDLVMGVRASPLDLTGPYLAMLAGLVIYAASCYLAERMFARDRAIAAVNRGARAERPEAAADPRRAGSADDLSDEKGHDGDTDPEIDGSDPDGEGGGPIAVPEPNAARSPLPRPGRGMRTFEDLARRVASLVAVGTTAYCLFYIWAGPSLFSETMALGIAEDLIDIVLIGYIVFHAVRIAIDRKIAEEGIDDAPLEPGEGEGGGTGASRLATLLPLVRSFVLGMILIGAVLAVATELGVNVAPLFAGAGILGLAIGFGSQTLVRDILSGAFFLMDDAFRRGEYIDVGEVKGTVEKISIRSFQLRHHLGMLHTIPFGEIKHLTNFSRDWVMMKLPLRLTYDTDVEKVRKLVKQLGQRLLEDPVIGDKFLQPLKSQGVIEMQDSAMIVRVKFMTKPGEQWVIRKRVFQEIRDLFDREGIRFAHREVTVRLPDLPQERSLTPVESRAVGSAARTALDVAEAERLSPTGTGGPFDDR